MDNPLDFIDFDGVVEYGDPSKWRYLGPKRGSPTPATSVDAVPGTMKNYDLYRDEHGNDIELHYFRRPDGTVGDVKIKR